MNAIYTITGLANLDTLTEKRCFGWVPTEEKAIEYVVTNNSDIHEYFYEYMVIECFPQGMYPRATTELWFSWNGETKGYQRCNKPIARNCVINFGIG